MSPGQLDEDVVHGYLEVDLGIVHRLLNEELDDFHTFAEHVEKPLEAPDRGDSEAEVP